MSAAPYHHGNLRAALVEAAAELARVEGPSGVVLREVARRTGVSHNAAYRHFADRDELLEAVAQLGMERLETAMRDGMAKIRSRDPAVAARRRLAEVGRAYVHFALDEPGLFEVAFAGKELPDDGSEASGPYAVLQGALDDLVDTGVLTRARRRGADIVCWAGVHGFAMLHLRGPLAEVPAGQREATLDALLGTLARGLTGP